MLDEMIPAELIEQLLADQRQRWSQGERVTPEVYLEQHPSLRVAPELFLELVYQEMLLREKTGDTPRLGEYVQRFPELAQQLTPLFEVHQAIEADPLLNSNSTVASSAGTPGGTKRMVRGERPALQGYEILEELGRGGMGVVYKARQASPNRVVALKMILAGQFASDVELQRFCNEAEAVANLQHPNIVAVHEVGEHAGLPYFSMDYVDGTTLAALVRQDLLPAGKAAEYVRTIAEAVHYAHGEGILHRDLKPANILIDKRSGQPRITDFGLAKRMESDAKLTGTGQVVGTPSYMPPEQAAGKGEGIGPASDVYALGAILYELVTGRPPFLPETPFETLKQVLELEPAAPRLLNAKVPRDLETICLKCLHKEPQRRYATAHGLAEELLRFLAGEPIQARPVGTAERLWRWSQRRPAVAGLVTALLFAVSGGVGGIVWKWREASNNARAEAAERARAEQNFQYALEAVDKYFTQVSDSRDLQTHGLEELRRDLLRTAQRFYQQFVEERGTEPHLRLELARAHYRLAQITAEIDSPGKAIDLLKRALTCCAQLAGEDVTLVKVLVAQINSHLGTLYKATGQMKEGEQALETCVELLEQLTRDHPQEAGYRLMLARNQCLLCNLYGVHGRPYKEASAILLQAAETFRQLAREQPDVDAFRHELALTQTTLATLYRVDHRHKESEAAFREAIDIQEALLQKHPSAPGRQLDLASSFFNLGNLYYHSYRSMPQAEAAFLRSRDLRKKLTRDHPQVHRYQHTLALCQGSLGMVYASMNIPDLAETAYREAMLCMEQLVHDYPAVTRYILDLAVTYAKLGDLMVDSQQAEAKLEWYAKSIAMFQKLHKLDPGNRQARQFLPSVHAARAGALARLGRHEEAIAEYDLVFSPTFNVSNTDFLQASRALCRAHLGEYARATEEAKVLAGKSIDNDAAQYELARVYSVSSAAALKDERQTVANRNKLAEEYANRAVEMLAGAHAAGYFKDLAMLTAL